MQTNHVLQIHVLVCKFTNLLIFDSLSYISKIRFTTQYLDIQVPIEKERSSTPRPRAALLMCLKKYSAIGNSAIGNYVVLFSKFMLKTVLLEVSYGKND